MFALQRPFNWPHIIESVLFALVLLLTPPQLWAEEVDDFTDPDRLPSDASATIDLATNALIDELINLLNAPPQMKCEDLKKYQLAIKKLDQNFTAIGNGLRAGQELRELLTLIKTDPKHRQQHQKRLKEVQSTWLAEFPIHQRDWFTELFSSIEYFGRRQNQGSIYENLNFLTCCTSRINIHGLFVGLDKIDHFFGNGGLLFEQFVFMKSLNWNGDQRLQQIMAINVRQEHTLWGLKGLSPKSYGDLAANWQGFQFYRHLFDENPRYIDCQNGQFKRNPKRAFKIRDFIDESWNESFNCSSFINQTDLSHFQKNLRKNQLQCPRNLEVCKRLVQKHSHDPLFVNHSLSPLCSGTPKNFTPIEEAIPISWEEAELSFRGFTWPIIKEIALKKVAEWLQELVTPWSQQSDIEAAEIVFTQLRECRNQHQPSTRKSCLQRHTEPGMTDDQLEKFNHFLELPMAQPMECPANANQLEQRLHPVSIGDISLCFRTSTSRTQHFDHPGRAYFRKQPSGFKIILLRF
jgi:hypothetical protein